MTVFLMGLDGASLENIHSVMGRISLPNFTRAFSEGRSNNLCSIYPYVTGPAWASIFSGVNPGKHGIFDMVDMKGASIQTPNLAKCDVPFLWDYLSWAGKRVLAVGVQFIHPAPAVNGVFVTGRFSPKLDCYPRDIKTKIDLSGFDYEELSKTKKWKFTKEFGIKEQAKRDTDQLRKRVDASLKLIDADKWDVAILIDSQPDEMFHLAYRDAAVVDELFKVIDSWLGELMKRLDTESDSLLILSDHGFSGVRGKFFVNEWLLKKGYLKVEKQARLKILRTLDRKTSFMERSSIGKKSHNVLIRQLTSMSGLPRNQATGLQLFESLKKAGSEVIPFNYNDQVAWLTILAKDKRRSRGVVNSILKDSEELKKQGFLKNIFRAEDLYHGKHLADAPGDVLFELSDGLYFTNQFENTGKLVSPPGVGKEGTHRFNGLIVFYGSMHPELSTVPSIYDILPTVLTMLRIPYPRYVDGKPIKQSPPAGGRFKLSLSAPP